MNIIETVHVHRSPDEVWKLFLDVPELARCLPGAELTEDRGDGTYGGKVTAKLGPMTAVFEGEAVVANDSTARSGTVDGKGTDRSGGSVGQVKMRYELQPRDGGTLVSVDADLVLSGSAAQFGRTGLIKEISHRLIGEFVECIEAKLSAATEEEAAAVSAGEVKGFSLFFAGLWAWLKGLFKRGSRRSG